MAARATTVATNPAAYLGAEQSFPPGTSSFEITVVDASPATAKLAFTFRFTDDSGVAYEDIMSAGQSYQSPPGRSGSWQSGTWNVKAAAGFATGLFV